MADPAREAFRSFGLRLGVLVTFDDALPRPMWINDGEAPVLVVPGVYTPEQQGELGAEIARCVLGHATGLGVVA